MKLNEWLVWKIYALHHIYCKYKLNKLVPGVINIIEDYQKKTKSTGTKFPTLYRAVKLIIEKKPKYILESGTGTSTLVLAEAVLKIQKTNPNYSCEIISMESIEEWYDMANNLLPKKYHHIVKIILGKRKLFEYQMFRGYCHSNIPAKDYDLVFLDGPNYDDNYGSSTCMDALKVRLRSEKNIIHCIVDTRVSTVFMMQKIFRKSDITYYSIFRASSFKMHKIEHRPKLNSSNFTSNINGRIRLKSNFNLK